MYTEEIAGKTSGQDKEEPIAWYAMCDQKRRNALNPAYKMLENKGFEVFTPLVKTRIRFGKVWKIVEVPFITDLLFVHSTQALLDPMIAKIPTLHYRYKKGGRYRDHIIVREDDMTRFINAVNNSEQTEFFSIGELPPELIGDNVLVHGGPLDGKEVTLRKMRGTNRKRMFVELPGFLIAQVELTEFDSLETVKKIARAMTA